MKFTILHTSDMHSKLTEPVAQKLAAMKASHANCLLLDSGDAIKSGNITFNPWGETMLALMNTAGYDAMCVGNREYHFLAGAMKAKTFKADFPLLSSNLVQRNEEPAIEPYVDFNIEGVIVRVMGLSVPCVTKRMFIHHLSSQYFEEPVKFAASYIAEIRQGCDILIALTHIGIKKDMELAEQTDQLDLILGGHTHTITSEPLQIGPTTLLHHGSHAKHVGVVTLDCSDKTLQINDQLVELGG